MKVRERLAFLAEELARRAIGGELGQHGTGTTAGPPGTLEPAARVRRALPRDDMVCWDLVPEAATVPRVRAQVRERLRAWDLAELIEPVELLVSELVTNAILHGAGRIGLRLIRGDTLLCEVGDDEPEPPRLRDAEDTDETGRGLLLVSHLAEHWGTRHTEHGKIVWFEQLLPS